MVLNLDVEPGRSPLQALDFYVLPELRCQGALLRALPKVD
jgi:hypothetical protein